MPISNYYNLCKIRLKNYYKNGPYWAQFKKLSHYKIRDSKTRPVSILGFINPFFEHGLQNKPNYQNHILVGKLAGGCNRPLHVVAGAARHGRIASGSNGGLLGADWALLGAVWALLGADRALQAAGQHHRALQAAGQLAGRLERLDGRLERLARSCLMAWHNPGLGCMNAALAPGAARGGSG